MSKRLSVARAAAALTAAAVLGASATAGAQTAPDCSTLVTNPNPVYIRGSSASQPVLLALAKVLGTSISIIYENPDSCYGLNDVIAPGDNTAPSANTDFGIYLAPDGSATTCSLSADGATAPFPDIGVSDVFLQTCADNGLLNSDPATAKLVEVQGPIQAMTFAVPSASNATAISAEAANVVFGNDAMTAVVPQWNVPANIFVRPRTSGTLNMIGTAIGLTADSWINAQPADLGSPQQKAGTGDMVTAVAGATSNQNATIGILSYEALKQANIKATAAGGSGQTLNVLAYQPAGASAGYLPDSASNTFDRLSVRQGKYDIWGPLHFIVNVDANGYPVPNNPGTSADDIATILNYFIATGPSSTVSQTDDGASLQVKQFSRADAGADGGAISTANVTALITAEATVSAGGVVPWCAMQVIRSTEIGKPASYQPDTSCGCFFEQTANGKPVSTYCQACTSDTECAAAGSCFPKCNFGFCEAQ